LGSLYQRNGLTLSVALAAGLALFLVLTVALTGGVSDVPSQGSFYSVFPHRLMVWMFAPVFAYAAVALGVGVNRFWRGVSPGKATSPAIKEATSAALKLKYLGGGHGDGCNNEDDAFTLSRRRFHHLTFYGFMLCFAATSVATLYHYAFGWVAPYGFTSLPKLLGVTGGIGLIIGPTGLFWLSLKRHPQHGDATQKPMDRGFIALLFLVSSTGLALMLARGTGAMVLLLAVHLGCVMAFFATMPYGKFAHGVYRSAALLKYAIERRQPGNLQLKSE
jgi:citrate/tricarballylate utilization protein